MLRKIKQILVLALAVSLVLIAVLNGKEQLSVNNIENVAMVESMGLDGEKAAAITFLANEINGDEANQKINVITSYGGSYNQANTKAQYLSQQLLTFSYVKHFIIGEPTAQKSINSALAYLCSSQTMQLSAHMYVCENSSEDFLSTLASKSVPVDTVLTNTRNAGQQDGYYYPVTLLQILRNTNDKRDIAVPIIKAEEIGKKEDVKSTAATFTGYGIFENGRMVCKLSREQSRGYNFVCNLLKRSSVECSDAVLEVSKSKCKIEFEGDAKNVKKAIINVKVKSDIKEYSGEKGIDEKLLNSLCNEEEKVIKEEILSMLSVIKRADTDGISLSTALDIYYNGRVQNKDEIAKNIPVEVNVDCSIGKSYNMKKV